MLKAFLVTAALIIASCSLPTNAQNDSDAYNAGNGIWYISKDTMRELIPAVSTFKQTHPECHITSMAGFYFHTAGVAVMINCQ